MSSSNFDDETSAENVHDVDKLTLSSEDCAFVLGKQGKTKDRIMVVSGATLDLTEDDFMMEIRGSTEQRAAAVKYVKWVMAQRVGPVTVSESDLKINCVVVQVPAIAVGFVTGKGGNFLRTIEDEWSVIMFFFTMDGEHQIPKEQREFEKLAIFGAKRNRRGAELKVMSTVEHKVNGYYTEKRDICLTEYDEEEDFGTETTKIHSSDLGYALGKKGATRKKIAAASECIVEYVNNIVFFSGTRLQIQRGKQYFDWLFEQSEQTKNGAMKDGAPAFCVRTEGRTDCELVRVPIGCVGYVTGKDRDTLSKIEEDKNVLMFFCVKDQHPQAVEYENLAIFGPIRNRVAAALKVKSCVENKTPQSFTSTMREICHPDVEDFAVDIMRMKEESISYALGKEGATRRKLAAAANCVLEYVGHFACFGGTRIERDTGRDYLKWLCDQRGTKITVRNSEIEDRNDCSEMRLRQSAIQFINSDKGHSLRRIEQETQTFMFMALDDKGNERLLIFGKCKEDRPGMKRVGRLRAERLVKELVWKAPMHTGPERPRMGGRSPTYEDRRCNKRVRMESPHYGSGRSRDGYRDMVHADSRERTRSPRNVYDYDCHYSSGFREDPYYDQNYRRNNQPMARERAGRNKFMDYGSFHSRGYGGRPYSRPHQ